MHYGILFELISAALWVLAISRGGIALLALWPSASFLLVGVAYYLNRSSWFGKRIDGTVRPWHTLALLPFLLYLRGVWNLLRMLSREETYNELQENVLIGRRPLAHEIPEGVTLVLDLTCEFTAKLPERANLRYANFPILDASAPPDDHLPLLVVLLESIPADDVLYVHCANGHGRTALASSILLLIRQVTSDWEDAYKLVKQTRPESRLSKNQKKALQLAAEMIASR